MDDGIIVEGENHKVKIDRDLVHANFRRLAEVILGIRTPAWRLDSIDVKGARSWTAAMDGYFDSSLAPRDCSRYPPDRRRDLIVSPEGGTPSAEPGPPRRWPLADEEGPSRYSANWWADPDGVRPTIPRPLRDPVNRYPASIRPPRAGIRNSPGCPGVGAGRDVRVSTRRSSPTISRETLTGPTHAPLESFDPCGSLRLLSRSPARRRPRPLPSHRRAAHESRPLLESRLHSRSQTARRRTRWQTRIEAIVQGLHGVQVLSRHDIEDGNVEEALDAAIEGVRLKMTPMSARSSRTRPTRRTPGSCSTDDVLLCRAGRLLAVVSAATRGIVVHRLASIPTPR